MPFVGIGLHIVIALFFAVHAIRTGQQMYWLLILFSFPLLGSIVYFLAIYMPDSRLDHGARKAVSLAARSLDPSRELREARAAFDYTPTAHHQMRLAAALLDGGNPAEAAQNYEACLNGPLAGDLDIRFGAARACLASGRPAEALGHLWFIRSANPDFRLEPVALLTAQALATAGRPAEAKAEYEAALARFGSFESKAEYAIWAADSGDTPLASRLDDEIRHAMKHWNRHTREINMPLLRRLNASLAPARQRG